MCLYELFFFFFVQKPISSFPPADPHNRGLVVFVPYVVQTVCPDTLYSHISAAKVGHGGHGPNQPVVHVFL